MGSPALVTQMARLQVLESIVQRYNLASQMGIQYGGDRDIFQALGYVTNLSYATHYLPMYERHEIAQAVINRPVKATWNGSLELVESDDDQETALEKEWKDLNTRLGLKTRFSRADTLTCLGEYGVLLLGLDDVKRKEDFKGPVQTGTRKLLYVRPLGQGSATINKYEDDTNSERYGQPLIYQIQLADLEGGAGITLEVHYTRVIHIIVDPLESEVKGTPQLQVIYNRLMDLEKIVGGDAEMFWRGARPGYNASMKDGFTLTAAEQDKLKDQIDEYEHNLRRILVTRGMDYNSLAQQVADPKNHVDIQISAIAAVKSIPKRILMGSERGELSSGQDADEWKTYIYSRRLEHAEVHIVRPFVDRCIELGILPEPKDSYKVQWEDLFAMNEEQRVTLGQKRAEALRAYGTNPAVEAVLSPEMFLSLCMGLTDDQIELVQQSLEKAANEEPVMSPGEEEVIEEIPIEKVKTEVKRNPAIRKV